MHIEQLTTQVSVSDQITADDVATLAKQGIEVLVCNRPDGESDDQTPHALIAQAAKLHGIDFHLIAFSSYQITPEYRDQFIELVAERKRIHAYCRTASRSKRLWREANSLSGGEEQYNDAHPELALNNKDEPHYEVVIVGAGSAGIAVASSLLKRKPELSIAIIDPSEDHYYQPGWTMVGAGIFSAESTHRKTVDLIPSGVTWIKLSVTEFAPRENSVVLNNASLIHYSQLVVAPGLELHWSGIEGLEETLGKNGVTSNYRYDLAPYTWQLVEKLNSGKAIFTQPAMPIKCAGAPQKALYLSADHWQNKGVLEQIDIEFYNSGEVLFSVAEFVPALMSYMQKYNANLQFSKTLVKVDGPTQRAWFRQTDSDDLLEVSFDLLHVCPPQRAPEFIRSSPLADHDGWLDVKPDTLKHSYFENVWGAGDVTNTANAKTMAAARVQAPIVAQNLCNAIDNIDSFEHYSGYGACPLTVERGKVVLAEFGYAGVLKPTFPSWVNNAMRASKFAWFLKATILPMVYWSCMLKGREWFIRKK